MSKFYTLDKDKNVIPCDLQAWSKMFAENDRAVAFDTINNRDISTVFLGLYHWFQPDKAPQVFETMIFGLPNDEEYMERSATWEEAEECHQRAKNYALL